MDHNVVSYSGICTFDTFFTFLFDFTHMFTVHIREWLSNPLSMVALQARGCEPLFYPIPVYRHTLWTNLSWTRPRLFSRPRIPFFFQNTSWLQGVFLPPEVAQWLIILIVFVHSPLISVHMRRWPNIVLMSQTVVQHWVIASCWLVSYISWSIWIVAFRW